MTNRDTQPPTEEPDQKIADSSTISPSDGSEESTVGTGTFFAIGCTLATALLIVIGIIVILILR